MVLGTQEEGRGGTICRAILFATKIQGGEIKEAFRADTRIEWCTIPEQTNESRLGLPRGREPCRGRRV